MNERLKRLTDNRKNLIKLCEVKTKWPPWFLDTGNYALNMQISGSIRGGFGGRFVWQLAGEEGVGKTRVWVQALERFLEEDKDRIAYFISTEADFSSVAELADKFGDRIFLYVRNNAQDIETEVMGIFEDLEYDDPNKDDIRTAIIIDSWGFISSSSRIANVEKGKQAQMDLTGTTSLNAFATNIGTHPLHSNVIMFIINHTYTPPEKYAKAVISGGRKLKLLSNGTLIITTLLDEDKENRTEQNIVKFENRKARWPAKRDTITEIPMEYNKGGLTRYGGLFDLCVACGVIERKAKGSSYFLWADDLEGKCMQRKTVINNPEKYFTDDRLDYIDKIGPKFYCLGNKED